MRIVRRAVGAVVETRAGEMAGGGQAEPDGALHAAFGILGEPRSETGGEGGRQAHHAAGTRLAELALGVQGVEIKDRRIDAAAPVMDDTFAPEAHDQIGASHQRVEPPVSRQLTDEVLGRPLPGEMAAELDALGAQIVGVDHDNEALGVMRAVLDRRALADCLPQRSGGERPSHLADQPARSGLLKQLAPSLGRVAEAVGGVVQYQNERRIGRALRRRLRCAGPVQLLAIMDELREAWDRPDATVLLALDQAEDALAPSRANAFVLLEILRDALSRSDQSLMAIATLRSDQLGAWQRHDSITKTINRGPLLCELFPVEPFPMERVSQVVREPANLIGLKIDDDLVDELRADTIELKPVIGQGRKTLSVSLYGRLAGILAMATKAKATLDESDAPMKVTKLIAGA